MFKRNISEIEANTKVIELLKTKKTIIYGLFFLLAFIIPISASKRNNLISLLDSSVNTWTATVRLFSSGLLESIFRLVDNGIGRCFGFIEGFTNFSSEILQFNFDIISTTGYVLTAIYLIIPLIVLYIIVRIIHMTKNLLRSEDRSLINEIKSRIIITPRFFFLILLFIPFPEETVWIGAFLASGILLYWYIKGVQDEFRERKGISYLEAISWKKTIFIFLSLIVLILAILEFLRDESLSLTSFTGIDPTILMIGFVITIFVLVIVWFFFYSRISKKTVQELLKLKSEEHLNSKKIIEYTIMLTGLIPIFDKLYLQSSGKTLVFIVINLPWILGLLFFDPFSFFHILITATKVAFDLLIDGSREITRSLIPIDPSEISIIGSFQPTIFNTLILFSALILAYIVTIFILEFKQPLKTQLDSKNFIQKYIDELGLILLSIIIAIVLFIFEPSNYSKIARFIDPNVSDPYQINTESISVLFFTGLILIVFSVIISTIVWGIIQIKKGRSWHIIITSIIVNSFAILIAIIMVTPFIWMLKNSVQTNFQNTLDFQRQGLFPDPFTTRNYAQLFGLVDPYYETLEYRVITWLFNSIIAAVSVTIFLVIFSAMAGYCLAKRDFVGRRLIFVLTIAIQMVPPYVQVIPLYLELNRMGFVGTLLGVILPFLIQPFSIFLCTEFMKGIPDDYLDAARIDGYSEFQIFRKIVLPLSIPVLSVTFIINIIGNWNAFMWPLLLLDQAENAPLLRTLPLGIYHINAELQEQVGVILALATIIVIPIFIMLFLAQDYIKRGVSVEGLKG